MKLSLSVGLLLGLFISGCASTSSTDDRSGGDENVDTNSNNGAPFASTYIVPQAPAVIIRDATVLTGTGEQLDEVDLIFADGKVVNIGQDLDVPSDAVEIDGSGRWLTPGIIDVHSHMGVYAAPAVDAHSDGNEAVAANTAHVWAEHSVWPQDPGFEKAIAGGITTVQILPGSANLFGGRGVTLKNVPSVTMMGMKFPDAPHSLKMACGENPKRVYADKGGPATRMGNMAGYRAAWIEAQSYDQKWKDYEAKSAKGKKSAKAPDRDLKLETLRGVLNGDIHVHNHCYRADEMANMVELAKEFNYKITAFHHAVEAYKIAPLLAENDICGVVWADWWGFKQEAFDMVRENAALLDYANACAIIHSDDEIQIQRLTQEVAKVMTSANKMGIDISRGQAIRWLTANPAKSLGLENVIGTLEIGKNADVVLWNGDPFSVYSKAQKVWIDGALHFDLDSRGVRPTSDFNLGILTPTGDRP